MWWHPQPGLFPCCPPKKKNLFPTLLRLVTSSLQSSLAYLLCPLHSILMDFLSKEWLFLKLPLVSLLVVLHFFQKINSYHSPFSALTNTVPFVEVQINCKVRIHHSRTKWNCHGNAGRADPKVMYGQGAYVIYSLYELNKRTERNKGW